LDNRLFVAYKPKNISSNRFLGKLKKKYGVKKAGYSGTLDPFACGVLIVAFGQFTKLFRFLQKSPKTYKATLWLGANSPTLDIEKIEKVSLIGQIESALIKDVLSSLKGKIRYLPPKYSAKKIGGKKAYELARAEEEIKLKQIESVIDEIKLLHYMHPYLTFEITISEGGYVRSIGEMIAKKLGTCGSLTYLERVKEGKFVYDNGKALKLPEFLDMEENFYMGSKDDILLGKKIKKNDFKIQKTGQYFIILDKMLSIIEISDEDVRYIINRVELC
jgi:tRNA pseudouridine55 synthase